jgi:signal transduction histidine kinase
MSSVAASTNDRTVGQRKSWCFAPLAYVGATVLVAVVAGVFSFQTAYNVQTDTFRKEYATVSEAALVLLKKNLDSRFETARALASILSNTFVHTNHWPLAYLYGFDDIVQNMQPWAWLALCSFPIVLPVQVSKFEEFAYNQYANTYPGNSTAESDFGRGIFSLGKGSTCFTCDRYHDTTGEVTYDSPYRVLTPILQSVATHLMYNFHSDPDRGRTIDEVIACAEKTSNLNACGALTVPVQSLTSPQVVSIYLHPVYPALNQTVLVGLTATVFVWSDILGAIYKVDGTGLQCVVKAADISDTYTIAHGAAKLDGRRDLHSAKYDSYAMQSLITADSNVRSPVPNYTVVIYPTDEFVDQYRTGAPAVICAVVVTGVLVLSAMLASCLYFAWVRSSSIEAIALSRAKRQFVRYISHEIRTPLNAMSLGLELLTGELQVHASSPQDEQSEMKCGLELLTPPGAVDVKGTVGPRKCKEWLRLVNELTENSQCAVLLLDDLLCFEQLEYGDGEAGARAPPSEISVLPAWELLNKALQEFDVRMRLSGVELDRDCEFEDTTLPPTRMTSLHGLCVLGNESQLQRVISNLLSNALHYSHEGCHILVKARWFQGSRSERTSSSRTNGIAYNSLSPPHSTDVSWLSDGRVGMARAGVLHVEITDEGGGLTAKQTAQVFGKHSKFRFSKLQAGQGSGIGLFVCKLIADQHHASIEVVSDGPGHGSTYILEVPAFLPLSVSLLDHAADVLDGTADGRSNVAAMEGTREHVNRIEVGNVEQQGMAAGLESGGRQRHRTEADEVAETNATNPLQRYKKERPNSCDAADAVRLEARISPLLERTVGKGAAGSNQPTDRVQIPTSTAAGTEAPGQVRHKSDQSLNSSFRNKRILVVDDAPSNRKLLVRVLERSGHVCDQAQDGQVAVDMVRRVSEAGWGEGGAGQYDMVLMDFEMPVMNGPTATRALREMGCLCPIVGVTGNVLGADVDYFLAQGADAVLPKPLQLSALEAVWDEFVGACHCRAASDV